MFFLTILLVFLIFVFILIIVIIRIQAFLVGLVVAIVINGISATTSGKGENTE